MPLSRVANSRTMEKYIRFVIHRPGITLAILFLITILLAPGLTKLEFDNSVDVMMPKSDIRYVTNEHIKDVYGNIGKFIIISVTADHVLTHGFFTALAAMDADIEEYRSYNEERETRRLQLLRDTAIKGPLQKSEFLTLFPADPPFHRFINRYASRHLKDRDMIDAKAWDGVIRAFEATITLKQQEMVDEIISVLSARDINGKDDTLTAYDIVEKDDQGNLILPASTDDFNQFKKRLFHNPAYADSLYATDSKTGAISDLAVVVRLKNIKKDDIIGEEIWQIAFSYPELHPTLQGVPIINKFMNDYMTRDFKSFMPLVLLVVLMVFFMNFKSLRGVFLPLTALALADTWTMGLMGHMGVNITIVGVSLPSLMIAIGSSYAIHILNQYYIDFQMISEVGKQEGLKQSMGHISVTVFLAGFTTFLGFLSLQTNQVTGIREWGMFSAIGVIFAVIITTSLIPAGLVLLRHKEGRLFKTASDRNKNKKGTTWIDPLLRLFTYLSIRRYKTVGIVTVAVLAVSAAGITRLSVETDLLSYFKAKDYMRTSTTFIGQKYGGSVGLNILIDSGAENGVLSADYLKWVDDFGLWLVREDNKNLNIGKVYAFTDIIKTMHMAMNGDDPAFYKVPDSDMDILDYVELYDGNDGDGDGRIDDFESFVDGDFRKGLIFAKIWEKCGYVIGTGETREIENRIKAYLDKHLPVPYTYQITGEPTLLVALSDYVVHGQLSSLAFCLIAVGLIVVLLFKNWKSGLLALIPLSFAVTVNFGIMGWFGISLDTATAIIASVAIGIGIDDTIHFLNTYRHFRTTDMPRDEAIRNTLAISGKAITYTSVALVLGFSVMIVSNFKPLVLVGILTAVTMIATTIGALVILPSVIMITRVSLTPSASDNLFWRIFDLGRLFRFNH